MRRKAASRRRQGIASLFVHAALAALMLTGMARISRAEDVPVFACAQGKPHYCFKYGQSICLKKNNHANPAAACEEWTQGCVECQTAIANCFERSAEPVLQGSAECTACEAETKACMDAIDKQYWPNR